VQREVQSGTTHISKVLFYMKNSSKYMLNINAAHCMTKTWDANMWQNLLACFVRRKAMKGYCLDYHQKPVEAFIYPSNRGTYSPVIFPWMQLYQFQAIFLRKKHESIHWSLRSICISQLLGRRCGGREK
jgi:hypothetical protein